MTPETPAQPPAAPESDVTLTEAEREALEDAVHYPEENLTASFDCACEPVYAVVERIVAERLRVVEGERDAARARLNEIADERDEADDALEAANIEAERFRGYLESAEAAHEALRVEISQRLGDMASSANESELRWRLGEWVTDLTHPAGGAS